MLIQTEEYFLTFLCIFLHAILHGIGATERLAAQKIHGDLSSLASFFFPSSSHHKVKPRKLSAIESADYLFLERTRFVLICSLVDSTEPPAPKMITPENTSSPKTNPAFLARHKTDELILTILFYSLTEGVIGQVISAGRSRELWTCRVDV